MSLLTALQVGGLQTNCYIVASSDSNECAVIDPGGDPQRIIDAVLSAGLELRYILCTHGHSDHTGGVKRLQEQLGGQFYLARSDIAYSADPPDWLITALGGFTPPPEPDSELETVETLQLGSNEISFIRTPGHTPGSTCFLHEDMVFTGDTLFQRSIGRYDLPGGDGEQELKSIKEELLTLPDDTVVYPGHGPSTTIGDERRLNPFLQDID